MSMAQGVDYTEIQKSISVHQMEDVYQEVARLKNLTSHIPAVARKEPGSFQKAYRNLSNEGPNRGAKSAFFDPLSLQYAMGYKDRRYSLTYDVLKRCSNQLSIVAAIINTRIAQIASFAAPYRTTKSLGYMVKHKDPEHMTTKSEREFIKHLEAFVANCGEPGRKNPYSRSTRDDFEGFLKKIVRDTLMYDQLCFETVPRNNGLPFEFLAVDAATIRIASTDRDSGIGFSYHARNPVAPLTGRFSALYENKQYGAMAGSGYGFKDPVSDHDVQYVQIINGQIENVYSEDELAFGVRNPRTDIYIQGYGYGEIEQLITIVTSLLFSEEYNKRYFCCNAGTQVTTDGGQELIEELVGKKFRIWDGKGWKPATAYATGKKPLVRTKLWNGLELETSPKHLFRVIPRESETGEDIWVEQYALKKGDVVLTGYHRSDPLLDLDLLKVGVQYKTDRFTGHDWIATPSVVKDPEFWEMIGFALGDGYWPVLGSRDAQWMKIFPHYQKDKDLFGKFLDVCSRYKINAVEDLDNKHIQRSDGENGYPVIRISHKCFIEWLSDLGFRSSSEGKRIPAVLFKLPAWIREAVLRGLFSADGHRRKHQTGYCTPSVFSADIRFRQDILRCLWSVKVAANELGAGWSRSGTIDVQDIPAFVEHVRYLQDYKNEDTSRSDQSVSRWDRVHSGLVAQLSQKIRQSPKWENLDVTDRDLVCKASRSVSSISRPRLISILGRVDLPIPDSLHYCQVEVDEIDIDPVGEVQMFDVEVFDDLHLFLANNMAVHNTQGSHPKGLLNFKGDNWTPDQLEAFKRQWIATVSGVENAWKTPITQSEGIEWINLQMTNKDMEFSTWIEYLIKIICGVYLIDPAEINFDLHGGVQQTPLFESSQEWKLKASRDRGLKPLLRFIARLINKFVIDKIDDHFVFEFVGLDELTEQEKHEMIKEQIASYMTLNEARRSLDLPDIPLGDVPINPTYVQLLQLYNQNVQQQQQMAQQQQQQEQQMAAQQQMGMQQPGQPQQLPPGAQPGGVPGQPQAGGQPGQVEVPPGQGSVPGEVPSEGPKYTANFGKSMREIVVTIDDWIDQKRSR